MTFEFKLHDFQTWLDQFSALTGSPVRNGYLTLPEDLGDGYIVAHPINEEMSFAVLHFRLKKKLTLTRRKTEPSSLTLFFNQLEVQGHVEIKTQTDRIYDESRLRNNIFLSSTNYDISVTYQPGTYVRRAGVCFSQSMLKKYIRKEIVMDVLLYADQRLENINREMITLEYKEYLKDIFNTAPDLPLSRLILQNRLLLLTEQFFRSFVERMDQDSIHPKKIKPQDLEGLNVVEEILTRSVDSHFPSVEELSRAAMMSCTKLKNSFKEVYGMKLYEYYNRNRLRKAKKLIESGRCSIKEAGMRIGFSNLSHFSRAFRKEFGLLPSELTTPTH